MINRLAMESQFEKVCHLHDFMTKIKKNTSRSRIQCAFKLYVLIILLGGCVDYILAYYFYRSLNSQYIKHNIYVKKKKFPYISKECQISHFESYANPLNSSAFHMS